MRVLTTQEIADHLAGLTYKPGWSIRVYDGRWEGQHVVITTVVEDAFNPGTTTTLDVHSPLPPQFSTAQLDAWVAWRLGILEVHEMREFLQRDGRPVFDPHAEFANRDLA